MISIRKNDKVKVLSGKDRGKEGDVILVDHKKDRVLVAKLNMAKRHTRPTSQMETGGIKDKEMFYPLGKIMLVCPDCKKGTRPKFEFLSDGSPVRVCRKCGNTIAEPKKR